MEDILCTDSILCMTYHTLRMACDPQTMCARGWSGRCTGPREADERDWVHIDRKWVSDILYTLDKNNFQNFINAAIKSRKERLESTRNLVVEMRPEFTQALNSCMNFSSK